MGINHRHINLVINRAFILNKLIALNALFVAILSFILRGVIEGAFLLSIFLSCFAAISIIIERRKNVRLLIPSKELLIVFSPYLILILLFILSYLFSSSKPLVIQKELISVLFVLLFILLIHQYDYQTLSKKLSIYSSMYLYILLCFGFLFYSFKYFLPSASINEYLSWIINFNVDNNMLSMHFIIAFLINTFKFHNSKLKSRQKVISSNLFTIFIVIFITLSDSRRGLFVFSILIAFTLFYFLFFCSDKAKIFKNYIITITFAVSFFSFMTVFFLSSYTFRNYIFDKLPNAPKRKIDISQSVHNYSKILKKQYSYEEVNDYLWGISKQHIQKWEASSNGYLKTIEGLLKKGDVLTALDFILGYKENEHQNIFFNEMRKLFPSISDTLFFDSNILLLPHIQDDYPVSFHDACFPYYFSNYRLIDIQNRNKDYEKVYYFKNIVNNDRCFGLIKVPAIPGVLYSVEYVIEININIYNPRIKNVDFKYHKIDVCEISTGRFKVNCLVENQSNKVIPYYYFGAVGVDSFKIQEIKWEKKHTIDLNKRDLVIAKNYKQLVGWYYNKDKRERQQRRFIDRLIGFNTFITDEDSLEHFWNTVNFLDTIRTFEFKNLKHINVKNSLHKNQFVVNSNLDKPVEFSFLVPAISKSSYKLKFNVNLPDKSKISFIKARNPSVDMGTKIRISNKIVIDSICNNINKFTLDYFVENNPGVLSWLEFRISNVKKNDTVTIENIFFSLESSRSSSKEVVRIRKFHYTHLDYYLKRLEDIEKQYYRELLVRRQVDEFEELKVYYLYDDLNNIENAFIKSRLLRWKLAIEYFKKYSIKEKLFGNGFHYLLDFSVILTDFNKDILDVDSPHNPYLSALLYSGILGFLVSILFTYIIIRHIILLYRESKLIFVVFFVLLFFSFFSGKTFFSFPFMMVYCILPFSYYFLKRGKHLGISM